MRKLNPEYQKILDGIGGRKSPSHIWKKLVLEFINQLRKDEFTFEDVVKYLKRKYGRTYEDLSYEQFEGRLKSTLNQLTKDGSFRKSRDFDYESELEKQGIYDIRLEKYKDFWFIKMTMLKERKENEASQNKIIALKKGEQN